MKYRFFTVPVIGGEEAEADLNKFANENKIAAVERRFVDDGAASLWAICVTVVDTTASKASTAPKKQSVDYREVLSEADFAVFARLRTLRKDLAEREGVPPYAIFTNEQLAAIIQRRVLTKTAMRDIAGIGDARIEKYAMPVLAVLTAAYTDHEFCPTLENGGRNGEPRPRNSGEVPSVSRSAAIVSFQTGCCSRNAEKDDTLRLDVRLKPRSPPV